MSRSSALLSRPLPSLSAARKSTSETCELVHPSTKLWPRGLWRPVNYYSGRAAAGALVHGMDVCGGEAPRRRAGERRGGERR